MWDMKTKWILENVSWDNRTKTRLGYFKTKKALEDEIKKLIGLMNLRNTNIDIIYCDTIENPIRIRYIVFNICVFDAHKIKA
jgi:hypothetical protein